MDHACPYCSALTVAVDGEDVRLCSACERSSLSGPPGAANQTALRRVPGEVPALPSAAIAAVVTVLFYGLLFGLGPGTKLFDLFADRGWVPFVITALSIWALTLLAGRWRRLRAEYAALACEVLPREGERKLAASEITQAVAQLTALPPPARGSYLVARVERGLRAFESRRRVAEVDAFLSVDSQNDLARVDASYGLIRVFVWAIPTLGFIGTVIGIGAAVGGFSATLEAASTLDGMKESIGSVTGGLGVAFDTTLLALVMSILIMFPMNAVQRHEEDLLAAVDDYCSHRLLPLLEDESGEANDLALVETLAERLVAAVNGQSPARAVGISKGAGGTGDAAE